MTPATILLTLLVLAYAGIAVRGVLRSTPDPVRRGVLLGLRAVLLILLIAAFVRPALTMRRLAPPPGAPLVLLDHSLSMSHMCADTLWRRVLAPAVAASGATVMAFGDSLRPLRGDPSWNDRRSYLPGLDTDPRLQRARRVVIVSDGNWSNTYLSAPQSGVDILYVPLSACTRPTWLAITPLVERVETTPSVPAYIEVEITASLTDSAPITVRGTRAGSVLGERTVRVPAGLYRDTVRVPIQAGAPGSWLCRLSACSDSLRAQAAVVVTVAPERLRMRTYARAPRLDCRFMGQALRADSRWEPATAGAPTHLLVVYDWDSAAAAMVRTMAPSGVVILAGVSACANAAWQVLTPSGIEQSEAGPPRAGLSRLAPVQFQPTCSSAVPQRLQTILEATVDNAATPGRVRVLSQGLVLGRSALDIPLRGFWRWDFENSEESPDLHPFSSLVLERARERILSNLTDALLAWPVGGTAAQDVPVTFALALPPGADWLAQEELRLTLTSADGRVAVDTSWMVSGVSPRAELTIAGLAQGMYAYTAQLARGTRVFSCKDTLSVGADQSELTQPLQNTALLGQWARAVSNVDSATLATALMESAASTTRETVLSTVRVEPNWTLLILALLVLAAEWLLRKTWRLD